MKKAFFDAIMIILIILIMLTSCNNNSKTIQLANNTYNIETDTPYFYRSGSTIEPIAKTPDGYYYVGNNGIVIYIEKDSMKATPLCNKANCKHDNPHNCNAYLVDVVHQDYEPENGTSSNLIQYYDNHIYTLDYSYNKDKNYDQPFLVRYNLDGTEYTKITNPLEIDGEIEDWLLHRGYFYFITNYSICRIALDNPKSKSEVIFESVKKIEMSNNISSVNMYGDYIYFDATTKYDEKKDVFETSTYVLDIKTLKYKTFDNGYLPNGFFNGALYTCCGDPDNDKMYFKKGNLNNTEMEQIETQKWTKSFFDPERRWIKQDDAKFSASGVYTSYDADGKELYSFELEENLPSEMTPQDEDYFFFALPDEVDTNQYILFYFDKNSAGGNSELQKLCQLSWVDENESYLIAGDE